MTKQDLFLLTIQLAWLLASIALILTFKVHRPRSLANAPAREGSLTLTLAGGIFLLYMGGQILASSLLTALHPPSTPVSTETSSSALGSAGGSSDISPAAPDVQRMVNSHVAMIIVGAALVWLIIIIIQQNLPGRLKAWGISLPNLPKGLAYGLLGCFIIMPWLLLISELIALLLQSYGGELTVHSTLLTLRQPMPLPSKIILILTAALVAPIVEECLFRGLIQTTLLQRSFGLSLPTTHPPPPHHIPSPAQRCLAIILTSILFAGIHGMFDQFPALFLLSLALGYTYERTGNLWASITLHASFNSLNLAAYLLFNNT